MADRNILQVAGGKITDDTNGILYAPIPAATPSGYIDAYIDVADHHLPLQDQIDVHNTRLTDLETGLSTTSNLMAKEVYLNQGATHNFILAEEDLLLYVSFKHVSGTPSVKVGTTASSDNISGGTYYLSASNKKENFPCFRSYGAAQAIHITITGGVVNESWVFARNLFVI